MERVKTREMKKDQKKKMRFAEIQLETHRLDELKAFYRDKLGLQIVEEKRRYFTIQAGISQIRFSKADDNEEPFYHFAFNIPNNQLPEAKIWLQNRLDLIEKDGKTDFHFEKWNADSVYFYDPAGNIVEFIARHNLPTQSNKPFSGKSIISVGEIGYPAENVKLFSRAIKDELNVKLWDGDEKNFAAVGDEEGLFIIVPVNRPWFPVDKKAREYPVGVKIHED